MITVKLRLFGAFRRYSKNSHISITVPSKCSVQTFRECVEEELNLLRPDLNDGKLVYESALANETEILNESTEISESCDLAILPPVCGG
ncbi:MAG: hypothetical protein M9962_11930 [Oligoflexia bacterium]|nr:hypothetical protein [Oligoflexia bacterium]